MSVRPLPVLLHVIHYIPTHRYSYCFVTQQMLQSKVTGGVALIPCLSSATYIVQENLEVDPDNSADWAAIGVNWFEGRNGKLDGPMLWLFANSNPMANGSKGARLVRSRHRV